MRTTCATLRAAFARLTTAETPTPLQLDEGTALVRARPRPRLAHREGVVRTRRVRTTCGAPPQPAGTLRTVPRPGRASRRSPHERSDSLALRSTTPTRVSELSFHTRRGAAKQRGAGSTTMCRMARSAAHTRRWCHDGRVTALLRTGRAGNAAQCAEEERHEPLPDRVVAAKAASAAASWNVTSDDDAAIGGATHTHGGGGATAG